MLKTIRTLAIGLAGLATVIVPMTPVIAAPLAAKPAFEQSGNVINVQQQRRKIIRRGQMVHRGGNVYYNGHRGYRHYRPGYRRNGDFWFPAGAFVAGALIGGVLNAPQTAYRGGNAHVRWCYDHYRSYRASDNTFQPNYGPRKQCVSP